MKLPYLALYKKTNGFKVYIVDGSYIRKNLNDQFTDFGQHYRFPRMIPLREFWLDKEYSGDKEYDVFIAHMLKEWDAMRNGKSYHVAIEEGDAEEKRLRELSEADEYKLREIGTMEDGVKVFLVNGKKIRDDGYIDFTEGGHDLVYDWIPPQEIWIDNAVSAKERPYILTHEAHERCLMGQKWKYDKAHNAASIEERKARHSYPNLSFSTKDGVLYVSPQKHGMFSINNAKQRIKQRFRNIQRHKNESISCINSAKTLT